MAEMDNLIHGEAALKKWIKEEMEKYADQIK